MAGPLAAPLIGAAGSLLGGLLSKPKNEYVVPDYEKIRAKAEAAGFNPLFAMANAPGQVVQSGGYMGSAVSDAAMIMADAVSKQTDAGKLSQVQAQNRALSKKVQSLTLRPKIGGIYAQRGVTPNLKQALGVGDGSVTSDAPSSRGGGSSNGRLKFSISPSVDVPVNSSVEDYVTSSGRKLTVPVGPDIDEVASGVLIEMAGAVDSHASRVWDTEKYTLGGYLNKAVGGMFMSFPGVAGRYMLSGEEPGEYAAAVKRQRDEAVARYKRDKKAGKIAPLSYIKPLYQ